MNQNDELQQLWSQSAQQLNNALELNAQALEQLKKVEAHTAVQQSKSFRFFVIAVGVLWSFFVDAQLAHFFEAQWWILLSVAALHSIGLKVVIVQYVYQIIEINSIQLSNPIAVTQIQLAKLKQSTLRANKLMWVQAPLFVLAPLQLAFIFDVSTVWLIAQSIASAVVAVAAIWIVIKIKPVNFNKLWFKALFKSIDFTSVEKAQQILNQLQ